jgi:hypothetical protein
MKRQNLYVELFYLLLLGMSAGMILVLGVVVAATIFNTQSMPLPLDLTHYEQGLIMADIFRKFSYYSYFLAFVIIAYELIEYKNFRRDKVAMIASFFSISTLLLFSAVYVPKILELQSLGVEATMSNDFKNIHAASEIDFKILLIALIVLFVRRVVLLRTIKKV